MKYNFMIIDMYFEVKKLVHMFLFKCVYVVERF